MRHIRRLLAGASALVALHVGALARPAPLAAHCDSLDGPVVRAAARALETGNVNLALIWVRPEEEPEIRAAFTRAMAVRALSPDARALADTWFFETVVRVHRQGEGAPYTGLKPAGYEPPEGIAAADHAIELGSVDGLAHDAAEHVAAAIRERFDRLQTLREYDPEDVAAGREWVEAYVEFIHFVEGLHAALEGAAEHAHASG